MSFDYIIVGAGAAGSVLAARLSDDPSVKILLLEYGGRALNPMLAVPKGFFFTLRGERYTYKYPAVPALAGTAPEVWVRGKVLGGSTAVNGMMYLRGAQADFDALETRGNPGWGWDRFLAAYRSMEDHNLGASELRGAGGPLGVSVTSNSDPLTAAVLDAAVLAHGWARVDDVNSYDCERIGFTPSTIAGGRRVSAYSAFLQPVRSRPNLTVLTRTRAGRLLFDGKRVTGVRARSGASGARTVDFTATREVILCAGSVETPLLLERSGIGRADVLRRAGIAVRAESPNVGERVIEQRAVSMQVRLKEKAGPTEDLNTVLKQGQAGLRYLATRRGPVATGGYDLVCQFKSAPGLDRPDVQGILTPLALDTDSADMKLAGHSGVMFLGYPLRPATRSSVHVSGQLPENPPVIDLHFLEVDADRDAAASILGVAREVMASGDLADLVAEEEFPGPGVSSRDDVVRYSAQTGTGIFHAVGSAAMGPGDDDVTDPRLRVRGVDGLRIADASVLPMQVAGNSAAPVMAVGWIAADLILADR